MKESIGYTVSLNFMMVFITIIIAFLCAALIYYKSNKTSNIITSAIEKYEGYNTNAQTEIDRNLTSVGYGSHAITCASSISDKGSYNNSCNLVDIPGYSSGQNGYCVYVCYEESSFVSGVYKGEYYYYKIRTNMMVNIPIINNIMDIPIYSNTNRLYNYTR